MHVIKICSQGWWRPAYPRQIKVARKPVPARAKGDPGNAMSYEPRDLLFMARQVVGAWVIVLNIAGLGLGLTVKRMDLAATASAAPVHSAPSAATQYPMMGVRIPGSAVHCRSSEATVEDPTDEAESAEESVPPRSGC